MGIDSVSFSNFLTSFSVSLTFNFSSNIFCAIALIENIQREDLNPIEEAIAYKRLLEEFHLRQDEIADRVSKSRTAVTNSMRLLK